VKKFKISQIQFEAKPTPFENSELLESYFLKSQNFKPDLICTPECSKIITNDKTHLLNYANYQSDCPIIKMTKNFCKKNKVNINLGSLLLKVKNKKKMVNRSIIINKYGKIQSVYDKIHLFDVNINSNETHRESNFFNSGKKLIVTKVNGINIGLSICYDLRFPNMYRALAKKKAQIILIPAAFTVPSGKAHWKTLVRARAIENSLFIVATNMCGAHHSKRKTYGNSLFYSPWGNLKNKCFSVPKILNSIIDLNELS
jgi:predicted amidohydrolase